MKRTTIYWILFFGILVAISWLYSTLNEYNEPILHKPRSNQYDPAQVNDLYLIKNSTGRIQRFFKVIETTKYGRAVQIAEGKPSYKNNFLEESWIKKGIERPLYFESKLIKVSKEYLVNLENEGKDFSIYRLNYPTENLPLSFRFFYSPLFVITCIGIIFSLIWLAENLSVFLNGRLKWVGQAVIFFLFSTLAVSVINIFQFLLTFSPEKNSESVLTMLRHFSYSILLNSSITTLLTLPFFFLFKFIKRKYLKSYSFEYQEFFKFLVLVIGGSLYLLVGILSLYFLAKLSPNILYISQLEFPKILQMTITAGVVACSIIGIANFSHNLYQHIQYLKLQGDLLNQSEQKTLSAQSDLDALQAKINPHFLYNSLNSIASLAQTNPAKTEEMALALSDFYKHSTNRQEEHLSTLELELKQLQSYLNIEKIRFGERLQYDFDIDEKVIKTQIPRFLLQPLVENAIKYGFNKRDDIIKITVQAEQIANQLHLKIMDSGEPFSGTMNTGYGLRSIKKKLKLLYPNAHELHFINKPIKQVQIILDRSKNQLYA